ncbi:MAG: hypothetical protein KAR22_12195, partial [Gammaproteobacteria bacterium]|nr:hypothetical protein [Gammaproteobacteria bacterium]
MAVLIAAPTCAGEPPVGYVHESWTIEDGLPVNGIKKLIQPSDGYLWMSTFDGLVRFDGVRFAIYNIGNTDGLPSNRIIDLIEAHDGSLWMMTEQRHVVRHDHGVFKTYGPEDGLADPALVIHADTHGTVWVGTENGLYHFEDGVFVPFGENHLSLPIVGILHARDGAVWVGVRENGARRLKDGQVTDFTKSSGLASNRVQALYEDDDGTIWIGSEGGINRYRDGGLEGLQPDAPIFWRDFSIIEFFPVRESNDLWIGTSREVLRYDYIDGVLSKIPGSDGALRSPNAFATDGAGDVWFYLGGRVHRNGEVVLELPPDEQLFELNTVLRDREGSLWIATGTQGLHRLATSVFTVYGKPEGLNNSNIYPILEDRNGAIWLGTWGGGVARVDVEGISNTANDAMIRTLCEDPLGHLWVGTLYGVSTIRVVDGSLRLIPGHVPVYGTVHAIYRDRFDTMWIGAERGLYKVRGDSLTQLTGLDEVPASYTRVFTETRDGALWMGTSGAGLERFRDGRFESFTEADGLSSNLIRAIHEDEDGYLWIGTEGRGL